MNLNLSKKKVLVTGSSKGIGLEIARQFALEGCHVVLNGRSEIPQNIMDTVPGSSSAIGDVSSEVGANKVVSEAHQKLSGLDIIVCNVGSGRSVAPGKENLKECHKSFTENFYSTTCIVEAARPFLKASQGVIICISSICGSETIRGAPVTYSVSKAALNAYVRGISRPLGEEGIRICGVAPGNIIFDGSVWDTKLKTDPVAVGQMLQNEVALNKLGSAGNVAMLTLFLASPISNNSTGCIWTSDGGQTRSI